MPQDRRYPLQCPICRVAMVGERPQAEGAPDSQCWLQRCLTCGMVVEVAAGEAADETRPG